MMKLLPNKTRLEAELTVVIRGVSERTEKLCFGLLAGQIDPGNIHLIHEVPFRAALKKSYEIGIAEGRPWTMVIDADILVRPGILDDLMTRARAEPKYVFAVQTEMLDKFFGGPRVGGIKVYRTAILPKALELIPETNMRPENFVIKNMHQAGYYVDITGLICGPHDFEQFYKDIFRKGFTYGIKHSTLTDHILPYWRRAAKSEPDFAVLLAGYEVARQHDQELRLDKNEVSSQFRTFFKTAGLREKPPLKTAEGPELVDKLMQQFVSPPEYQAVKREIIKMGRPTLPEQPAWRRLIGRRH